MEVADAQLIKKEGLRPHHVLYAHHWEGHGILCTCGWVEGGGATASIATSNEVRAYDRELVSV